MKDLFLSIKAQLKTTRFLFFVAIMVFLVVVSFVVFLHGYLDISFKILTSDVTAAAEVPLYYGFLSQLGILIWVSAAAICLFTYYVSKPGVIKRFFLFSGLITLYLVLDDMFLFHEELLPRLGIHQKVVFLLIAIGVGLYALKFRRVILNSNFILFGCAIGFFGLSLFIDNFLRDFPEVVTKLTEESAKFLGIVFWLLYFFNTG
ncbi:MAG: hypothetical protein AAF901_13930, partial [Bacteroidota bacterium]